MFNPTRDQAREFFFELWAKHGVGKVLTPLEAMALDVVLAHPEYHEVLADPDRYRDRTWTPEGGETNPFLHLSLHLAIAEQASIDQPPGIRDALQKLASRLDSRMMAEHEVMECLTEQIWQAQRNGAPFSNEGYLDCIARRAQ